MLVLESAVFRVNKQNSKKYVCFFSRIYYFIFSEKFGWAQKVFWVRMKQMSPKWGRRGQPSRLEKVSVEICRTLFIMLHIYTNQGFHSRLYLKSSTLR